MVLIGIAMLFLLIGVWEHGRKLAIVLFLCFLALGILDLRNPDRELAPLLSPSIPVVSDL